MLSKRHTNLLGNNTHHSRENDSTNFNVQQEDGKRETCYICYQPENKKYSLIESPCGQCKLKVHQYCFEQLQLYEHTNHRCVILDIGHSNHYEHSDNREHYIVYTTCGVCKHRFEYKSHTLIDKLAEQLLSNVETIDETEPELTTADALIVHKFCHTTHAILSYIPEPTRSHICTILQKTFDTMANTTSLEEHISYLQYSIHICSMSIYFTSFAVGLSGLLCLKSFSHHVLQNMW